MTNGVYIVFRLRSIGAGQAVAGGRHHRLAEADAAVAAGAAGVPKDGKTAAPEACERAPQQKLVLEDTAGEGHRAEAVPLARRHTAVLDEVPQAVAEAGRDNVPG